jgi:tetratricopeptide (TPR) repeat protein
MGEQGEFATQPAATQPQSAPGLETDKAIEPTQRSEPEVVSIVEEPPVTTPESIQQVDEVERLYQRGADEFQAGALAKSYDSLSQARRLDPNHQPTQRLLGQVKPQLVDQYHKQALILFREQQNLCGAIRAWDKVLALDPGHVSALTWRDKAQRMATTLGQSCR